MAGIVGVKNPYGLIQQAGRRKKRTQKRKKNVRSKNGKSKKNRK